MVSLLEAYDLPYFVQNRGFGSLYPGMQIHLYNVRRVMIREDCISDAVELLSVFSQPTPHEPESKLGIGDRLRVVAEVFLGGWAVPYKRGRIQDGEPENISPGA